MATLVKVAEPDELPPGRGKTVTAFGRDITVMNREGRYVAIARARSAGHAVTETACEMPGRRFPIGIAESDRVELVAELHYPVRADERGVFVIVED
jgi:hypothetical protein